MKFIGHCTYRKGKVYFDDAGWNALSAIAKKRHTTVRKLVIAALKRALKRGTLEKKV